MGKEKADKAQYDSAVAALDFSLNAVTDMMEEQKLGDAGFLMLMTKSGMVMYADKTELYTSIQDAAIGEGVKRG